MAVLDIKNCDFYIKDGYVGPAGGGLVNNGGGYMAAAVTMITDGWTGAVAVGDVFTVVGDTAGLFHTITAHTESSGHTTSITFTPGLGASVADDAAIIVEPHRIKIRIGDGTLDYNEKRPIVYVKDRGLLDTVRLGDQDPVEVKLDFTWVFLRGVLGTDVVPTIEEALKNTGVAVQQGWVSSSTDPCEPYCVDLEVVYTPPCPGNVEAYSLPMFRYEDLAHNFKTGQVAVTGKCNVVAATVARSATAPF